mgnify:CR=1 FL=1
MAKILKRNPLFISEPPYVKQLESEAEGILSRYAKGKLIVAGDNRFLSGDLFWLISFLLDPAGVKTDRHSTYYSKVLSEQFPDDGFYAPGAQYSTDSVCTILRNPHIARNEEIQLRPYTEDYRMSEYYFGHLTDVLMVDNQVLAAERLGGADFDGDMVKTIASPVVNQCVRKNYDTYGDKRTNVDNIPVEILERQNHMGTCRYRTA